MFVSAQSSVSKQSAEGYYGFLSVPVCPSGCLWNPEVRMHRERDIDSSREMTGLEAMQAMYDIWMDTC